jgi:hypothetical protein
VQPDGVRGGGGGIDTSYATRSIPEGEYGGGVWGGEWGEYGGREGGGLVARIPTTRAVGEN